MAGYCVRADVVREMGRYGPNLTAISHPSTADADALIDNIAREIDGILAAKGILTPVVSPPNPASVLPWINGFLARLNAIGTAGVILQGLFPHASGPASSNLGDDKTKEYRTLLMQMAKDGTLIPDAITFDVTLARGESPRSLWTNGNVDTDAPGAIDPENGPIFTRVTAW